MTNEELFAEVDLVVDQLPSGTTFADNARLTFREAQKAHRPDLSEREWLTLYCDWARHHCARLKSHAKAIDARALELLKESDRLHVQCKFLPSGPLRDAAEQRVWAIGKEIGRLYASRRPAPPAANWVADSEAS